MSKKWIEITGNSLFWFILCHWWYSLRQPLSAEKGWWYQIAVVKARFWFVEIQVPLTCPSFRPTLMFLRAFQGNFLRIFGFFLVGIKAIGHDKSKENCFQMIIQLVIIVNYWKLVWSPKYYALIYRINSLGRFFCFCPSLAICTSLKKPRKSICIS